ncbi:MAG: MltA domain-containing protein [Pseudomonadota bacterium]
MKYASLSGLQGWTSDSLSGAIEAFTAVPADLLIDSWRKHPRLQALDAQIIVNTARTLLARASSIDPHDTAGIRNYFENCFTAQSGSADLDNGGSGLVTGYFDPLLKADRHPSDAFPVPLYARPSDLINLVDEDQRATGPTAFTHARRTKSGSEPFSTRAEIEAGALNGQGLELCYLADPVDAFFLHVQGSGKVIYPDGESARLTYYGKNGHPYTSIGAELIAQGDIEAADMTLDRLAHWLRSHPAAAREIMQRNQSYVFFKFLDPNVEDTAHGVLDTPLHPLRSLAVDTQFHVLGLPVFVAAPSLAAQSSSQQKPSQNAPAGFSRLMFAHDVGSAIKGRHRGDIYFGSGDEAGRRAGATKHSATLTPLLPIDFVEALST